MQQRFFVSLLACNSFSLFGRFSLAGNICTFKIKKKEFWRRRIAASIECVFLLANFNARETKQKKNAEKMPIGFVILLSLWNTRHNIFAIAHFAPKTKHVRIDVNRIAICSLLSLTFVYAANAKCTRINSVNVSLYDVAHNFKWKLWTPSFRCKNEKNYQMVKRKWKD